jgi:hypothetical protein
MQVNCAKCSQPIALTEIIESNNGHLSHVDCKRPQILTPEERALVFLYCSGTSSPDARRVTSASATTNSPQTSWGVAARTCALGVVGTSPKPFAHIFSAAPCCLPQYDSGHRR